MKYHILSILSIFTVISLIIVSIIQTEEKKAIKDVVKVAKMASDSIVFPDMDDCVVEEEKIAKKPKKMNVTQAYIERFKKVAICEHQKFGIPASITLAQGILESNSGQSQLAIKDNNHFGIKCKSKCLGCRCANYADDSKYDMFRIFETAWESYREHSILLQGARYAHLQGRCKNDFVCWAKGLQEAGYATNKKYSKALIAIVKKYSLQRFDKLK